LSGRHPQRDRKPEFAVVLLHYARWDAEEILQSLALMLESSDGSQRIPTAKLAASVGVSEALTTIAGFQH
jgi:GGDEF domain-containing protein